MQTNCKIMIRGKGSVKDGKVSDVMAIGFKFIFFVFRLSKRRTRVLATVKNSALISQFGSGKNSYKNLICN